jgi:3-deoxy-D-manno-octulosonic-acid transferase
MMNLLYGIFINLTVLFLPVIAVFNKKIKRFLKNRKYIFKDISNQINSNNNHIWIHAASLGEYELAVPLIKKFKEKYDYKIVLTFFSESGFKLKNRASEIDYTFYLPIDSRRNARKFVRLINPIISIFIKSEIWPNYISELNSQGSKKYLVEASFKYNDWYFQYFNFWIRNKLKIFDKIFVVDKKSESLLNKNNITHTKVVGSMKFDRVKYQLSLNNNVDKIDTILKNKRTIVFGSTWEEDEELIVNYIKKSKKDDIFWIIAPHDVSKNNIERIKNMFDHPVSVYSEDLNKSNILILNTIGDLKKLYSYSEISYVGGGMGNTGLHNILEACIFEVPVIIGKNYKKFNESIELVKLNGVISIKNQNEFNEVLNKLIENEDFRIKKTNIIKNYFNGKTGATNQIIKNLTL